MTKAKPRASTLRLVPVGFTHPDAHRLIEAVQEEYVVRYGGRDTTPLDRVETTGGQRPRERVD